MSEGHLAVVTGANAGLGYEVAKKLVESGSQVIVAGRSAERVGRAVEALNSAGCPGTATARILDLANLASVREFAASVVDTHQRLDLLINNAGIMAPPAGTTVDGFETQFGVNFVGHFALTGRLFPVLDGTPGARVVTMSSIGHRGAAIDFGNLRLEKPYDPWREYGQSKLADLIFALELHDRLSSAESSLSSLAAHPGVSESELVRHLPGETPPDVEFMSTEQGAKSALVAALSADAVSGQYWGPDGPEETKGEPGLATIDSAAQDTALNRELWEWAQDATGVSYP